MDLGGRHRRHRPRARPRRRRPRPTSRRHSSSPTRRLPPAIGRAGTILRRAGRPGAETEPVRDLLSWLRDHLDRRPVGGCPRAADQLVRAPVQPVFKSEVGITAAEHVEAVRLEAACRLLETTPYRSSRSTDLRVRDTETMNRAFRRRLNTTPGEHRHHFVATPDTRHVDGKTPGYANGVRCGQLDLALSVSAATEIRPRKTSKSTKGCSNRDPCASTARKIHESKNAGSAPVGGAERKVVLAGRRTSGDTAQTRGETAAPPAAASRRNGAPMSTTTSLAYRAIRLLVALVAVLAFASACSYSDGSGDHEQQPGTTSRSSRTRSSRTGRKGRAGRTSRKGRTNRTGRKGWTRGSARRTQASASLVVDPWSSLAASSSISSSRARGRNDAPRCIGVAAQLPCP